MTTAELATLNLRPIGVPLPPALTQDQIEARHNFELACRQMSGPAGMARRCQVYEDDAYQIRAMLEEHESALNLLALILAADALTPEHKAEAQTLLLHNS